MTHCDWLVTQMHDKVWDWLAYGFPAEEQLPKGVSLEDYRLTHRNFRQLEENNIVVMFWKVAEGLIPEPGRMANDYLDMLESDPDELHNWQTGYEQHLFRMMLNQMMRGEADNNSYGGDAGPCNCRNCDPAAAAIASRQSREEQWRGGEENKCSCSECREFVQTHGIPEKTTTMKTAGKGNEKTGQTSAAKLHEEKEESRNKKPKAEHVTVEEIEDDV